MQTCIKTYDYLISMNLEKLSLIFSWIGSFIMLKVPGLNKLL